MSKMEWLTTVWNPAVEPWTSAEIHMANISAAIRAKPDWQSKLQDPTIRAKWKQEALEQDFGYLQLCLKRGLIKSLEQPILPQGDKLDYDDIYKDGVYKDSKYAHLTEEMVDWLLDELQIHKDTSGIKVSCFDGIYESSTAIPTSLRDRLLDCVAKLEDVPPEQQDWHPGSNNQVLDLVHPSLFPIVYGKTRSQDGKTLPAPANTIGFPRHHAPKFCWLPTDFIVSEDGKSAKSQSYINNIHPEEHKALYSVIEEVLSATLPLLAHVVSKPVERRIAHDSEAGWKWYKDGDNDEEQGEDENEDLFWARKEAYKVLTLPHPRPFSEDGVRQGRSRQPADLYSFAGKMVQVITKLANIHLTPESPDYSGGSWHLEGTETEKIVASAIYYYDNNNVTDSQLAFRSSFDGEDMTMAIEQSDYRGARLVYGVENEEPCVQPLGAASTPEGLVLAWPNRFQHQVQPFSLVDKTQPGHRKILAFFLVHPEEPIPSTTTIPPQQLEWAQRDLEERKKVAKPALPQELWDTIEEEMKVGLMSLDEAKNVREELMNERRNVIMDDESPFQYTLSLCEH
ncbi:hypothetical protein T439DRAFT_323804 [Meredithblackwellia eburnea MCA 4105]